MHVGAITDVGRNFRGHQDLRTVAAQRLADERFRLTLSIGVGGLDEVDAGIDRLPQDALGCGIIHTRAEIVGAQTNDRDLETRVAQPAIFHHV